MWEWRLISGLVRFIRIFLILIFFGGFLMKNKLMIAVALLSVVAGSSFAMDKEREEDLKDLIAMHQNLGSALESQQQKEDWNGVMEAALRGVRSYAFGLEPDPRMFDPSAQEDAEEKEAREKRNQERIEDATRELVEMRRARHAENSEDEEEVEEDSATSSEDTE